MGFQKIFGTLLILAGALALFFKTKVTAAIIGAGYAGYAPRAVLISIGIIVVGFLLVLTSGKSEPASDEEEESEKEEADGEEETEEENEEEEEPEEAE